jgi:peptidoglycan-N-acetylglucosamine deacetylase
MGLRVAATFDLEHPSRSHHDQAAPERLLDVLAASGVRATFFIQGRWARAYPGITQRVASEGHLIGNHSHQHARMNHLTDEGLRADVRAAQDALVEVAGVDPRPWFRCPFGAGHDDPRVLRALAELGYENNHWTVDSLDYVEAPGPLDAAQITAATLAQPGAAVVLWHTWPRFTPEIVASVVPQLRAGGAELVGLDELERSSSREERISRG